MLNQPQRQTPTPEERLKMAVDALDTLGIDTRDPRYHESYQNWAHNLLSISETGQPNNSRWVTAAERAEELGFGKLSALTATELDEYLSENSFDN